MYGAPRLRTTSVIEVRTRREPRRRRPRASRCIRVVDPERVRQMLAQYKEEAR